MLGFPPPEIGQIPECLDNFVAGTEIELWAIMVAAHLSQHINWKITDFCVLMSIGLSSTCGIAKFETRAFYFTCNYTISDSFRVSSILQSASVIREKIALVSTFKLPAWQPILKPVYLKLKEGESLTCGIAKSEAGAFYLTCIQTINNLIRVSSIFILQSASHAGVDCPGSYFQVPCMSNHI